jgi:hypothetical protein
VTLRTMSSGSSGKRVITPEPSRSIFCLIRRIVACFYFDACDLGYLCIAAVKQISFVAVRNPSLACFVVRPRESALIDKGKDIEPPKNSPKTFIYYYR